MKIHFELYFYPYLSRNKQLSRRMLQQIVCLDIECNALVSNFLLNCSVEQKNRKARERPQYGHHARGQTSLSSGSCEYSNFLQLPSPTDS
jgi:hypothetical protein